MDLDRIDAERRGPMVVREHGELVPLPAATELPWRVVAAAIGDVHFFATTIWPAGYHLTGWKLELAQQGWIWHNGLPELDQARRLVYMYQRYYTGVEYDLRHHLGLSAGDLWRERRWRELLNYIDQLPTNSQMNRLLSQDEEHMEQILRSSGSRSGGRAKPSMADWSLTNSLLSTLIDAVNKNTAVNQAIANPKGPKPRVEPTPRPATVAEKIERKITRERHDEMVSILLPNRR